MSRKKVRFGFYLPFQLSEIQRFTGWTDGELCSVINTTPSQLAMLKKTWKFSGIIGQNIPYALEAIKDLYQLFYYNSGWFRDSLSTKEIPVDPFIQAWFKPYKRVSSVCSLGVRLNRLEHFFNDSENFNPKVSFNHLDDFIDRIEVRTLNGQPKQDPSDEVRKYPKLFRFACYVADLSCTSVCELTSGDNRTTVYHLGISPVMDVVSVIRRLIRNDKKNADILTSMIAGKKRKEYITKARLIVNKYPGKDWRPRLLAFLKKEINNYQKEAEKVK